MYIYESSDSASSIIHFLPFDININTAKFVKRSLNSLVDEARRDMCFQQGALSALAVSLALRSSAEVPTCEDEWSHKSPEVKEEAHPAGAHFDPHS